MADFKVVDELPKVRSGRPYERTAADDGLDALDKQTPGKALAIAVSEADAAVTRNLYVRAAGQRQKKITTRYNDGILYVAYRVA